MEAKTVMYAALGAPVVLARNMGTQVTQLKERMQRGADDFGKAAETHISGWAVEGERVYKRMSEGKVVDEITSRVDLDAVSEQVGKLRDQLEGMLATWKTSFRPEKAAEATPPAPSSEAAEAEGISTEEVDGPTGKPAEKKPASAKPAGQKAPASKPSSSRPAPSKPADKAD